MFSISDRVKIVSLDSRTKIRTDLHGNDWEVMSEPKPMFCFNGEQGILIRSILDNNMRNIRVMDLQLING